MTRPSRVSNSQPSVWKAGALPTALPGHVGEGTRYQDEKLEQKGTKVQFILTHNERESKY